MNATPFTPNFVGSLGQYPIFDYVDNSSNTNYIYTSNSGYISSNQISSLKQKDISHDGSISSINSTIGGIQTEVGALGTLTTSHTGKITLLETLTASHTGALATHTGALADLNLNKLNKSSFNGVSVIYRDAVDNIRLMYNPFQFKETFQITTNSSLFNLQDNYANLPTTLNNTSNDLYNIDSNSSNTLNTKIDNTSNSVFTYSYNASNSIIGLGFDNSNSLSNLNSNSSNTLFKYTSNSSNTLNTKANDTSNSIFTYSYNASNTLNTYAFNSSNNCINYANTSFLTSNNASNTFYTKSQINNSITTNKLQIGTNNYGYTDTIVELDRNVLIRKNALLANGGTGDLVQVSAGIGLNKSSLFLSESGDAGLLSYIGVAEVRANNNNARIYGSNVEITATNNIELFGNVKANGKLARKSPIYFTTNRTFSLNSVNYSAYDIDLDLYTKKELLDGFSHRHFRVRLFFSNGRLDFQFTPTTYQIYMTSYNSLSIKAYSSLYGESELDQPDGIGYFLYRNSIDKLTFCASTFLFGSSVKVYNVFEDLL